MRYTTVLFDFDETLAHAKESLYLTIIEVLLIYGYPTITYDDYKGKYSGVNFKKIYRDLTGKLDVTELVQKHIELQSKHYDKYKLYPKVYDTLARLHFSGCKLGLISSANKQKVTALLKLHHLDTLFDAIITQDDVIEFKPHPEPFEKILRKLNAEASSTLMVGDSNSDIEGGKNAHLDTVAVTYSTHREAVKELRPTHMIKQFDQLIDIVLAK